MPFLVLLVAWFGVWQKPAPPTAAEQVVKTAISRDIQGQDTSKSFTDQKTYQEFQKHLTEFLRGNPNVTLESVHETATTGQGSSLRHIVVVTFVKPGRDDRIQGTHFKQRFGVSNANKIKESSSVFSAAHYLFHLSSASSGAEFYYLT